MKQQNPVVDLGNLSTVFGTTSKGQYPKTKLGNCYYKLGNFTGKGFRDRELIAEVLCARLCDLLGISTFDYQFCDVSCMLLGRPYHTVAVVSRDIEKVKGGLFVLHGSYLMEPATIEKVRDFLGCEAFTEMILFDAFTRQEDRHENNYGVLLNGEGLVEHSPVLFDFGRSLMYDTADELLMQYEFYDFVRYHRHRLESAETETFLPFLGAAASQKMMEKLRNVDFSGLIDSVRRDFWAMRFCDSLQVSDRIFEVLPNYFAAAQTHLTNLLVSGGRL